MIELKRKFLGTAAAVLLLTGCSSSSGDSPTPEPSSTETMMKPSPTAPFVTTVDITAFGPQCQQERCWLPTQFKPALVEHETVSLYDKWPMDHDQVEVLCQIEGETFDDEAGNATNLWFGIRVPANKLEPGAKKRAQKAPGGGYLGYVGVAWLVVDEGVRAPACKK